MLAQVLAVVIGLGSGGLYLAAFFFPEIHRRHDFFWSGVGLFYALVLWVCAVQISFTEFLGHLASVALLSWLGWQTLTLRRKRTPVAFQTPLTEETWPAFWHRSRQVLLGWLQATPLGRWLPDPKSRDQRFPLQPGELRASTLKDIGYEFVDDIEPVDLRAPSTQVMAAGQTVVTPASQLRNGDRPPAPSPARPSSPTPKAEPLSPQPASNPVGKPQGWWTKGRVIVGWLAEVVQSARSPKPKKPVIDIPPRPSSLTKSGGSSQTEKDAPGSGYRQEKGDAVETPMDAAIAIIDTAAVDSTQDAVSSTDPPAEQVDRSDPQDLTPEDTAPEDLTPEDLTPEDTTPEDITPQEVSPGKTAPDKTGPESTASEAIDPVERELDRPVASPEPSEPSVPASPDESPDRNRHTSPDPIDSGGEEDSNWPE